MKSYSWLITPFAFIFVAVSCSPPSAPNSTGLSESVPDLEASIEAPQAAADTESNHAKEVEGLISARWAKTPYRPDVYEGANYPDPHREAFSLAFKNNGDQSISAFKGTLRFLNVFEEEILAIPAFEQDKTMLPGKEAVWTGSIQTLGNAPAENLYTAEHEKVKIVVVPDLIVFSDGSRWSSANGLTPSSAPANAPSPPAAAQAAGKSDSKSTVPRPGDPVVSDPPATPERLMASEIAMLFLRAGTCKIHLETAYVMRAQEQDMSGLNKLRKEMQDDISTSSSYAQAIEAAAGNDLVLADLPRLRQDVIEFCSQPLPAEVALEGKAAYVDSVDASYEKLGRDYGRLHGWMRAQ